MRRDNMHESWSSKVSKYRWLIASLIYIALSIYSWQIEVIDKQIFSSVLSVAILVLAYLVDTTKSRGDTVSFAELQSDIKREFREIAVPFLIRVSDGAALPLGREPRELHDVVVAKNFWDWSYYRRSWLGKANAGACKEIKETYLSHRVDTSTLSFIDSEEGAMIDGPSVIITGIVHGDSRLPEFPKHPWDIQEYLRPLKAYTYYLEPDGDTVTVKRCRVYGPGSGVDELFTRTVNLLSENQHTMDNTWTFPTEDAWDNQKTKIPDIHDFFKDKLSTTAPIVGRTLSMDSAKSFCKRERFAWGLILVVGFALSPFSLCNDSFVNIPLSVWMAKETREVVHLQIWALSVIYYILSNAVGVALMALSLGKMRIGFNLWPSRSQVLSASCYCALAFVVAVVVQHWIGWEVFDWNKLLEAIKAFASNSPSTP